MNVFSKIAVTAAATLALAIVFNKVREDDRSYTVHSGIQIGNRTLPTCVARDGTAVQYVSNRSEGSPYAYKTEPGIRAPFPNVPSDHGAYIVLPEDFTAQMSDLMMLFVVAHECAHHKLGHTIDGNIIGEDLELMRIFEAEADCAAVDIMRNDYDMTENEILKGTEQFFLFLARDIENDPTIHGTAAERHARSLSCLP